MIMRMAKCRCWRISVKSALVRPLADLSDERYFKKINPDRLSRKDAKSSYFMGFIDYQNFSGTHICADKEADYDLEKTTGRTGV
jgi:hypothetical protein